MNAPKYPGLAATAGLILAFLSPAALCAEITLWSNADYTAGHFRQTQQTRVSTVTAGVEYAAERWTTRLVVPYVHVNGPDVVVPGVGLVQRPAPRGSRHSSGYGDPTLSAQFNVQRGSEDALSFDAGLDLKLGTSNPADNVATSETDLGLHVDAYRSWDDFTGFATLGYRFVGRPDGWNLRDVVHGTLGWKYRASSASAWGMAYMASSKTSGRTTTQGRMMVFITRRFGRGYDAQLHVLTGASRSSPALGMGLTVNLSL